MVRRALVEIKQVKEQPTNPIMDKAGLYHLNKQGTTTARLSNKQESKMKNTLNKAVDVNKTALTIAAQLATGKTANSFFLSKILGKFPWYTRMFAKKHDITNDPIAKMVTAQTALVLATHFAPDNAKLNYVAEGMVQEALVDITVNSQMLDGLIKELDTLITLPDFNKE